jgi:hypothetical protein
MQTAVANALRITYNPSNLAAPPYALIEKTATNLLKESNNFHADVWGKVAVTVQPHRFTAPDGIVNSADFLIATGSDGYVSQLVSSAVAGQTYTFSVWLRSANPTQITIFLADNGNGNTSASLTVDSVWRRYSVTRTIVGTNGVYAQIGGGNSFVNGENVYAWGAQMELGSVATSYFPTPAVFGSRGTVGTYFDSSFNLQTASANVARISYDPTNPTGAPDLMVEGGANNSIRNNTMQGGTVGTIGSGGAMPNNWQIGTDMGMVFSLVQKGTENGIEYCDIRIQGTSTTQGFAGVYFDTSTAIAAATGQVWAGSVFLTVVGGSTTNVSSIAFCIDENTSAPAYVTGGNGEALETAPSALCARRLSYVRTLSGGASVASVSPHVKLFATGNNVAIDITLRFGLPQMERDRVTSPIRTTNAAVGRSADVVTYNQTRAADQVTDFGLLYSNIAENDAPGFNSTVMYTVGQQVMDQPNHKVYQSAVGEAGTATISIGTPAVVTFTKSNGDTYMPPLGTPIVFSTNGALPAGVSVATFYYVKASSGSGFTITTSTDTVSGSAVATSGTQNGTHYATASSNINKPFSNKNFWLEVGPTNRWKMFDQSITSQSSNSNLIVTAFYAGAGKRVDSFVGLNCAGNKATLSATDITTGEVFYSANVNLVSTSGIQDIYSYFYEPIVEMPEFLIEDVPSGSAGNAVFVFTLASTGSARCGGLVVGLSKELGLTDWGAKVGTVDYSVKSKDVFGNYTITPRAFSKKGDFTVQVPTGTVDFVHNLLSQYRSTPIVYVGSNSGNRTQFNAALIYGFYKDFSIDIGYSAFSACSLSVEGLT